jgi:aryl-alcohol dehydrogenase-like predicted oxidoreductase
MDEYKRCLDLLSSRGYHEIDTARVYVGGKQEAWTREAGWKERGFKIASKWYPHEAGAHKPEVLKAKVEESLKELGTDSVDIYYLHAGESRSDLRALKRHTCSRDVFRCSSLLFFSGPCDSFPGDIESRRRHVQSR